MKSSLIAAEEVELLLGKYRSSSEFSKTLNYSLKYSNGHIPVLSSNIIILFQAKLCSGFRTVAFLQAFSASIWRFKSAY